MKAAYIESPGSAASIRYGELPLPALADDAVRVRVEAVAVNHVDTYIRGGAVAIDLPLPFVIGRDMVGRVQAFGARVKRWRVGDAVWSNCLGIDGLQGSFAELVSVPDERLYPLPAGVEPRDAVAVLHSALTAVIGLRAKARLAAGDSLFVNGGSGSVGLAVLQIAKACGARVAVTAGSDDKAGWCRESGADRVIDYRREDLAVALREFAPSGLDVYWEATRGLDLERAVPLMARNGRFVVVAADERPCPLPTRQFYLRNCSLHGFTVTGTSVAELGTCARQINAWLANGTLRARVQQVMPLAMAAQAHRLEEEGRLAGKLVLVPEG